MKGIEIEDQYYARMIEEKCTTTDDVKNHVNGDAILLEILRHLGYDKTISAFKAISKYYC